MKVSHWLYAAPSITLCCQQPEQLPCEFVKCVFSSVVRTCWS